MNKENTQVFQFPETKIKKTATLLNNRVAVFIRGAYRT